MQYEDFKKQTIEAELTISKANDMRAVSDDFAEGFHKAMWEAREIYLRLEDDMPKLAKGGIVESGITANRDGSMFVLRGE